MLHFTFQNIKAFYGPWLCGLGLMYKLNINTDVKQITRVLLRILVRFSLTKLDFKTVIYFKIVM